MSQKWSSTSEQMFSATHNNDFGFGSGEKDYSGHPLHTDIAHRL